MELKKYQQDVINDIDQFIDQLEVDGRLDTAFSNFWEKKGVSLASLDNTYLRPYDNSITGVPHITVKVPTAGGKTFIACNALRTIFSHMPADKPRVVAWFVPSDTILKQTYKISAIRRTPIAKRSTATSEMRSALLTRKQHCSGRGSAQPRFESN